MNGEGAVNCVYFWLVLDLGWREGRGYKGVSWRRRGEELDLDLDWAGIGSLRVGGRTVSARAAEFGSGTKE